MANRFEVYAPTTGRHLVTYIHGLTFFDFQDIVGTERVKITQDGANSESTYSLPFGDGQSMWGNFANSGGPTHFDGKDRDTETGNDYFGARYFNSTSARWMSPDWSRGASEVPYANYSNPQTLNLYAFVGNNPVGRFDADGHQSPGQPGDDTPAAREGRLCKKFPGAGHCTGQAAEQYRQVLIKVLLSDNLSNKQRGQAQGDIAEAKERMKKLGILLVITGTETGNFFDLIKSGKPGTLNYIYATGDDMEANLSGSRVTQNGTTLIFVNVDQTADRITTFETIQALTLNVDHQSFANFTNAASFGLMNALKDQLVIWPLLNSTEGPDWLNGFVRFSTYGGYQAVQENAHSF